jgi:nucleoside-diphosphate-sugar epimerase
MGADAGSGNLYYRTKGEMEKAISVLKFKQSVILRPSVLYGPRKDFRMGERIGQALMWLFWIFIPAKYKLIHAKTVARKMVLLAKSEYSGVVESGEIRKA